MATYTLRYLLEEGVLFIYNQNELVSEINGCESLSDLDAELLVADMADNAYMPKSASLEEVQEYLA